MYSCMAGWQADLNLWMSSGGMPLCCRIAHCVLPVPFFAAALLFFATKLPGCASAGASLSLCAPPFCRAAHWSFSMADC